MPLAFRDLGVFANAVLHCTSHEPEIVKTAFLWSIRNRLAASGDPAHVSHEDIAQLCLEAMHDAGAAVRALGNDCREVARSVALTGLVWADELSDPTGGAWRCHRHDETPEWASNMEPRALIGPLMFYR